jgi:hypothetical protein
MGAVPERELPVAATIRRCYPLASAVVLTRTTAARPGRPVVGSNAEPGVGVSSPMVVVAIS